MHPYDLYAHFQVVPVIKRESGIIFSTSCFTRGFSEEDPHGVPTGKVIDNSVPRLFLHGSFFGHGSAVILEKRRSEKQHELLNYTV